MKKLLSFTLIALISLTIFASNSSADWEQGGQVTLTENNISHETDVFSPNMANNPEFPNYIEFSSNAWSWNKIQVSYYWRSAAEYWWHSFDTYVGSEDLRKNLWSGSADVEFYVEFEKVNANYPVALEIEWDYYTGEPL